MDIDHVLRKEPNMTCLTPSHEEKIPEGSSCTLLDTVGALTIETNRDNEQCLLGESKEMEAAHIEGEIIQDLLQKVTMDLFKETNLPFLKAQMYKDYKKHVDPSLRGNKETRKVVQYNSKP